MAMAGKYLAAWSPKQWPKLSQQCPSVNQQYWPWLKGPNSLELKAVAQAESAALQQKWLQITPVATSSPRGQPAGWLPEIHLQQFIMQQAT